MKQRDVQGNEGVKEELKEEVKEGMKEEVKEEVKQGVKQGVKEHKFEHQRWFIVYRNIGEGRGDVTGMDKKTKDT